MSDITMPRLSDSMQEGTILAWLKGDGDAVQAGDDLVEIETDKATMTWQAEASGTLTIVAAEGVSLAVGETIGRLGEAAAPAAVAANGTPPPSDASTATQSTPSAASAVSNGRSTHERLDETPPGEPSNGAAGSANRSTEPPPGVRVTPLARRVAAEHGVDLAGVAGSGPLGRITRSDVLGAAGRADAAPSPAVPVPGESSPGAPATSARGEVEVVAPTRLQTVIARRMAEAKATVPHFQVQTEVAMDAAFALRAQLKETGAPLIPSVNDLIVKASALALREHPLANGAYVDGRFERYPRVNIGIAVAADEALVVPTIFDADLKSLGAIAADARRLATAVRDGTVTPAELAGATFTVSNLGMFGMTAITPVINLPQAAILGVGAAREVLARVDGEIVDRRLMTLSLSCDHRILYGATAAQFLSAIRSLLQAPLRLVL